MIEFDIRAGQPIIYLVTPEESRAELELVDIVKKMSKKDRTRPIWTWSATEGFKNPITKEEEANEDPIEALEWAKEQPETTIVIMKDLHPYFETQSGSRIRRMLRDIARDFKQQYKCLILLSPVKKIPEDLERDVVVVDFDLPTEEALGKIFDNIREENASVLKRENIVIDDDERELIVSGARGLTTIEAETAFAKAIVERARRYKDAENPPAISKLVLKEKASQVKKTGILEYFEAAETEKDVGGLDDLKLWLKIRKNCFSKKAKEFGLPNPRGILLVGLPGCIAEGTEITYKRGKRCSGRVLRIEALHARFHGIRKYGGPAWAPGIPTLAQSWDVESGKIAYAEMEDVISTGEKPCIRITTDESGSIDLTEDHLLLAGDGRFIEAGELEVGDTLLVRGSMLPQASGKPRVRRQRASVDNLPLWYRSGSLKKVTVDGKTYEYKRQRKSRLVIEAHMNKMNYDEYLEALRSGPETAEKLQILSPEYAIHHADEDPMNDVLDNLVVMLTEEHQAHHGVGGQDRFNIEFTKTAKITAIESIGVRKTFDIKMREPGPHNFCTANGIIAHNCGKSLTAKAASNIFGVPLIRFDISRLFGGIVGMSESNTRNALKTIDAIGNSVVWIDEMEKAFAGMGGGGTTDSGVTQRIFGMILTWMQEKTSPSFIMATVNQIDGLPSELLRKGRLDEIFYVGLPTPEERRQILEICIRRNGRDPEKLDGKVLEQCAKESDGFSGAELNEAVISGLYYAFYKNKDLHPDYIWGAIQNTTPLSKSRKTQLAGMRKWAEENAVPASPPSGADGKKFGRKLFLGDQ